MYNEADCKRKLAQLKERAQQKKKESEVLLKISKETELEANKILARAEFEKKKHENIQKFIRNVDNQIYDKYRSNKFTVMSTKKIPKDIIKQYLKKKWDIEGNYLDPKSNEIPWQYVFTKIMIGEGVYTEKKYTNIYEE